MTLLSVEGGSHAADVLEPMIAGWPSRDAGLATELVLGTLRRRAQVDWLIRQVVARPMDKLDREVCASLRLGAYQLRFLDRIPEHSAVNESVELVKWAGKRSAAGLVNASLRRLPDVPARWPDEETRTSMPGWLLARWRTAYGPEAAVAAALAALERPDTYVRMPGASGPGLVPTEVEGGFRWTGNGPAPEGARFQDIGSQSIVPLLDLKPGHLFLDVCAAPGNKTRQALETEGLRAVACDVSHRRLRSFLADCPKVEADASRPLPFGPVFDRVLVDAPCSGTGTLSRNPEIRWRLLESDLPRQQERQVAILREAAKTVALGGRLVYSTCSLEPEENQEVVAMALPEARVVQVMQRLPGRDAGEGFWAAVLSFG